MGFIEIAAVKYPKELNGIWNDYVDISKMKSAGSISDLPVNISDGMRFFIGQNQSIIMLSDNKVSDYIAGSGAFVFHKAFESGKYTAKSSGLYNAVQAAHPELFGDFSENTKCYLINMPDWIKIPFVLSEASYFDKSYMLNLTMQGSGYFEVGVADPLAYFAEMEFENGISEKMDFVEITEEEKNELSANFENMLKNALLDMKEFDIGYDKLIYNSDVIANGINSDPRNKQYLKSGTEIKSIEFSSLYPDENSIKEIVRIRRNNGIS